jgi:tetratricopeptide (TPR) repeat protein
MARVATLCLLAVLSGSVRAAPAADLEAAHKLYDSGQQHYRLGEYVASLADFKEAYRLAPLPAFLFNIAQCHRELGQDDDALRFYRSYLASAKPNDPERPNIEQRIVELERRIDERARQRRLELERSVELARIRRLEAEVQVGVRPPGTARGARALKWAGVGVSVLGVAMVLAGIGPAVVARRAGNDIEGAAARNAEFDPAVESRLRGGNIGAGVLFAIGGVVAASGAVMIGVGATRQARWRALEPR